MTDNRTNEPTEARISDADLSDEHLPNRAYKVGRRIAERGDFDGLDAATVFMRGAVYGVRKFAVLDPEKVAEVERAAAARAWDEGESAGQHNAGDGFAALLSGLEAPKPKTNPYRAAEMREGAR